MNTLIKNLRLLSDTLWQIENEKDFKNFLEDILTPKEIKDISDRIKIFHLLKQWLSQREISKRLGISITTVNRWSRITQWWTWSVKKIIYHIGNLKIS